MHNLNTPYLPTSRIYTSRLTDFTRSANIRVTPVSRTILHQTPRTLSLSLSARARKREGERERKRKKGAEEDLKDRSGGCVYIYAVCESEAPQVGELLRSRFRCRAAALHFLDGNSVLARSRVRAF